VKILKSIVFAASFIAATQSGSAQSFTDMLDSFLPVTLKGMGACEGQAKEPFFVATGCPGHMQLIWDEDISAFRGHEAQLILWAEALTGNITSDTAFFTQGPGFMSQLPPRLPFNMAMLKLRYPEVAGIALRDQVHFLENALSPIWHEMQTSRNELPSMVGAIRDGLRQAGMMDKPSILLSMMGRHDSFHVQNWALSDRDAAAEFMARLDRILVKL
jgi:hypothetical protein